MPNRLAEESSPYLLQHQNNPVDWYPWGAEALLKSRAEDKPIFLSIGYSACHWCHVMEHQSFENQQIAEYLNKHFVSIKVDREERPDLDQIYMQAVMAMSGHGGWPLSAFLTPDQDFFFGGTYWPPTTTAQMPGFDRVLASVLDAYHNNRDKVIEQSKQITGMINQAPQLDGDEQIDESFLKTAALELHNRFDGTFGGFGVAPKFPHPMDLTLLTSLYEHQVEQNKMGDHNIWSAPTAEELLEMVQVSLRKMAYGGIFDHLAGGFARYSVDARWLVPHFEKMLYDNALLARVYVRTFQATGDRFYARITEKTLDYLSNDMTDPGGGFYSTEDADSEGVEGKFYVWTRQEVVELLGPEVGGRFCQAYDVTESGNFEGENILNLPASFAEVAHSLEMDKQVLMQEMREARQVLLKARNKRVRPGRDEKILTSWNALAIQAFADAAIALNKPSYGVAAQRCAEFVWTRMRAPDGRLLHSWKDGKARLSAYLDDYAGLIDAFVSLYRIDFDAKWVERARYLAEQMVELFHDDESGAFFYTASDHEKLIARTREFQDTAVPSGNSMALTALVRLGQLTGNSEQIDFAMNSGRVCTPLLKRAPTAASQALVAIEIAMHNHKQVVLVPGLNDRDNKHVIKLLQDQIPLDEPLVVIERDSELASGPFSELLNEKTGIDDLPTLYVCENFACKVPLVGLQAIEDSLQVRRKDA